MSRTNQRCQGDPLQRPRPSEVRATNPSTAFRPAAGSAKLISVGVAAVLAVVGGLFYFGFSERTVPPAGVIASFVGGKACAGCHAKEYEAWKGSHHELATQEASEQTVLGNFTNAKFSYAGITSTFFKREGKFFVNTDGSDGKLADFEIS